MFTFSIPCKVVYSPLRCEGIGLSDGEVMHGKAVVILTKIQSNDERNETLT